jgi:predicted nucleic acid-binding protein
VSHELGLLDTSVVIDLAELEAEALPVVSAVSAITFAELSAGPIMATDRSDAAIRQEQLQRAVAEFDPIPFDHEAARAYGRVVATTIAAGRKARGAHTIDLLIAAVALAAELPLYTRNGDDFRHLEDLIDVVVV